MNQNKKQVNIPTCYGKAELTGNSSETNYSCLIPVKLIYYYS